jgi:hypothetical protein
MCHACLESVQHGRAVVLVCRAGVLVCRAGPETAKHSDTQEEKHMYTHINMDVCIATFSCACDRQRLLQTKSLHLCQENKCRDRSHALNKCLGRAVVLVCRPGTETEKHADTQEEKRKTFLSCAQAARQEIKMSWHVIFISTYVVKPVLRNRMLKTMSSSSYHLRTPSRKSVDTSCMY